MKYAMLLLTALIMTFSTVDVLFANNVEEETLVSCTRSRDRRTKTPEEGKSEA